MTELRALSIKRGGETAEIWDVFVLRKRRRASPALTEGAKGPPWSHILHYRFQESAVNCSIIQSEPEKRPRGEARYEEAARHRVLLTSSVESAAKSQPVRCPFR